MNEAITRRTMLMATAAAAALQAVPEAMAAPPRPRRSARIEALIARMTVEEKAGQLNLPSFPGGPAGAFNPVTPGANFDKIYADAKAGRITGAFNSASPAAMRRLQEGAVKESRLGIPLIFGADVIHGYRTIFPVPLAEASSWDPDLAERTARAAAVEASAMGLDWNFAPMVDIARDARWGRMVEGAGEDVLLGSQFAAARVRGFQGRSLKSDDAVLSCPKHFAAYGAAEAGLDYNSVDISERTLREVYLPPFKAGFDAGALSTMAAFNEINGVPAHGNTWLLTDVLRREWGFRGFVVSDFKGEFEMIDHGFAADEREAAKLAILAGVDMSMVSGIYLAHLPDLVAKGEVPMAKLDDAVRRVLTIKEELGLFEDPYRRLAPGREARVRSPANIALAREAARRSIVMLKNEGNVLPLPASGKRIALIGPFAEDRSNLNGPWTVFAREPAVDLPEGIRAVLKNPALLTVTKGSNSNAPIAGGIDAAVAAAKSADVVLLAIGEDTSMSGEAASRADIGLPAAQQALVEAVVATGKPVVVLLKNGRALALQGAVLEAQAILVTWFLGSQTGNAIADILFGLESPSGRLPVSFPRLSGQVPFYYAHKNTGRPNMSDRPVAYRTRFSGITNTSRFPFGHGLTYGQIEYSELDLGAGKIGRNGMLTVIATIANKGSRAAVETVQLYIRDMAASLTRPVRELKAYRRISLAPGQSQRVTFTLRATDLAFLGANGRMTIEPGLFTLWVAPSAEAEGVKGTFTLTS